MNEISVNRRRRSRVKRQKESEEKIYDGIQSKIDNDIVKNLFQEIREIVPELKNRSSQNSIDEDEVLKKLFKLQKQAKKQKIRQAQKFIMMAIGKRILNIEIQRKTNKNISKKQRKKKIQQTFRDHRISQIDYHHLALTKMEEDILIVKPYNDGRGFLQNPFLFEGFRVDDALKECQYDYVVKNINKIFFSNFAYSTSNLQKQESNHTLSIICGVFVLIFLVYCISLLYVRFEYQEVVLVVLEVLVAISLCSLIVKTFFFSTKRRNQLDEVIYRIQQYFEQINRQNRGKGKRCQWVCPSEFLYLEVKFTRKLF